MAKETRIVKFTSIDEYGAKDSYYKIQKHKRLFFIDYWVDITQLSQSIGGGTREPIKFKSVEKAKAYIEKEAGKAPRKTIIEIIE